MNHGSLLHHRRRPAALRAALCAVSAAAALLAGCAYKITIQQGNFLDEELVDQVESNMTRQQVQFLLGTPMISDPFHADRWDYLYYVISGKRRRDVEQGHFIVYFENDRVASVERIVGEAD
jgi:outer membrane protein assembly factor BamE